MFFKIDFVLFNKMYSLQNSVFSTGLINSYRYICSKHRINQIVGKNYQKRVANLKSTFPIPKKYHVKTSRYIIRNDIYLKGDKMEVYKDCSLAQKCGKSFEPDTKSRSPLNSIQNQLRPSILHQQYLLNKIGKAVFVEQPVNVAPVVVPARTFTTLVEPKVEPLPKNLYKRPPVGTFSTSTVKKPTHHKRKYKAKQMSTAPGNQSTLPPAASAPNEPQASNSSMGKTQQFVAGKETQLPHEDTQIEQQKTEESFTVKASKSASRRRAQETTSKTANVITDIGSPLLPILNPKNVLHNIYQEVYLHFDNIEYKLRPTYTIQKDHKKIGGWTCTYAVKWPEPLKFCASATTKKMASHQTALLAMNWLKKHDKITKDNHPIFITSKETKELLKKTVKELTVCPITLEAMNNMIQVFEDDLIKKFISDVQTSASDESDVEYALHAEDDIKLKKNFKQIMLKNEKYMAKEKYDLPIAPFKEKFIELLRNNNIVIVKGEPGCGKSTRIPQYVLESWITSPDYKEELCRIAVTQPRRIAAISLADCVANEREEQLGQIVGYQVRLKNKFMQATGRILYCTTGILLRHFQSDPHLSNFSHIILDEAHERDVNTDLLMNLIRDTLKENPKLKLIVMSATIDTDLFQDYFENAAVMHIPGFTHPVKQHFIDDMDIDLSKTKKMLEIPSPSVVHDDVVATIKYIDAAKPPGAILCFLPGWEDISKIEKLLPKSQTMVVNCLHSRLPHHEQWKIFSKPPPGVRKVILSTNIAETSVTIDDVVYVIDTGIHKENNFDNDKGVMCIDNHWISQASMIQRKGRAGRCQPGESFHLYTKKKFESLSRFTDPEILKTSLTKIILDSKVYSNNKNAIEFMSELLSPPDEATTRRAVRELKDLELLDEDENLTYLGKALANFQLEPKLSKVLINSMVFKCVTPIIDIITLFSDGSEIFSSALKDKETIKRIKMQAHKSSDHLAVMRLFEKWMELKEEDGEKVAERYCEDANLINHKLVTMEKLRKIHFDYLYGLKDALPVSDDYSDNDELVKAILFSGVGTVLHHRDFDIVKGRYKKSNVFLTPYNHKAQITTESVNFKKTAFPSNLLVYIHEVRSNVRRMSLVRECSVISPIAVLLFSNKELTVKNNEADDDLVVLGLKNTNIEFLCHKKDAEVIKQCKQVIDSGYQYFIFQLTEGGNSNHDTNYFWDKVLENLNTILIRNSV